MTTQVEQRLTLLRADMAYLRRSTKDSLGGHGIPAQLKRWIAREYGPTCVKCGRDFPVSDLQLGHLISAGAITPGARAGHRGGYVPGNIALWCKFDNDANGDQDVSASDLARPDLVPLAWPAFSWRKPIA